MYVAISKPLSGLHILMNLIEWSKDLSVGVQKIDNEHKQLIAIINKLHETQIVRGHKKIIEELIESLVIYTRTHFQTEERLMKNHECPTYLSHKKMHDHLVMQVYEFQQKYNHGIIPSSNELAIFLQNWLTHHIQGTDKQMGLFLNQNGVY